jgi:hypothetical protein
MGARKKNRSRFEHLGRFYHWYQDDWRVRICSEDKKFAVAYFMGDPWGDGPHLEVFGHEFPGIKRTEKRPVRLCVPPFVKKEFTKSLGAFVNAVIRWGIRPSHRLKRFERSSPRAERNAAPDSPRDSR